MDTYQPIYDAVRSKISGGDIGASVERVLWEAFDIGHQKALICEAVTSAAYRVEEQAVRPSVTMRPRVFPDGNAWCALYGDDLVMGVAGFGDTPAEACAAFDKAWTTERARGPAKSATSEPSSIGRLDTPENAPTANPSTLPVKSGVES